MRGQCFKAQTNRRIEINHNLEALKIKARANLESDFGKEIYSKRCIEPEPVFGNIKQNKGFKRFTMNKLPKINIEFGLIAIAHNFSKWLAKTHLPVLNSIYINLFEPINDINRFLSSNYKIKVKYLEI